jgi:hypothetical protein
VNATFISDESNRDQNKHHDENNALLVLGQIENAEQALHRSVAQLSLFNFGTPLFSLGLLQFVILIPQSREKNLSHFFLHPPSPTARDVSLRST